MIVPATLAGIRTTAEASQRNMALGLCKAVGRRRGLRPAGGRYPAGAFLLGSVFLINVPIVLVVIAINAKVVPRQPARREQPSIYCRRSF